MTIKTADTNQGTPQATGTHPTDPTTTKDTGSHSQAAGSGSNHTRDDNHHLLKVTKPARYLGGEVGSVVKDHRRVEVKVAMAFPDTYEVGMSHLGMAILYKALNQHPRIACERVFAPWFDMEEELTATGKPLTTLETGTPLAQFDVIGFSLQHELTYTNVLQMLKLAGIPLRSADRRGDPRWPLIMAGGPCANHPEPMAPFIDVFFIGEGEAALPEMIIDYIRMTRDGVPMYNALTAVAAQAGGGLYMPALHETMADPATGLHFVLPPDRGHSNRDPYVIGIPPAKLGKPVTAATGGTSTPLPRALSPMGGRGQGEPGCATNLTSIARRKHPRFTLGLGLPFPISRVVVPDLDQYPFPGDVCVPLTQAVFDRLSVEIARGCDRGCRFCEAGFSYLPKRERSPQSIVKTVLEGIRATGFNEVGLTSLSTADYSAIEALITHLGPCLAEQGTGLSVSSLRAYGLKPSLLKAISRMRTSGLTLAPEAGTQRMRDVINKNITEDHLLEAASNAFELGWNRLKLYFMIGLPTETDHDVEAIAETAKRVLTAARRASAEGRRQEQSADRQHLRTTSRRRRNNPELSLSVACHVPRPHTPFQWEAIDSQEELERKQRLLGQACRRHKIRYRWHNAQISRLECILARGDRRLADTIEAAFNKGCRFDGWDEFARLDWWEEALEETVGDGDQFTGALPVNSVLPWSHINMGVNRDFLIQERERAYKGQSTFPCGITVTGTKPATPPPATPSAPKALEAQETLEAPEAPESHTTLAPTPQTGDQGADTKVRVVCYRCGIGCTKEDILRKYHNTMEQGDALPPCSHPARDHGPESSDRQPDLTRFRLLFAKVGNARMLGHLDLVRHFPRILKRAGAELALTQGFTPKPRLVFGPALRLGAMGLGEYLDFIVQGAVNQEELARNLASIEPMDGLVLLGLTTLPPQAPSISKSCTIADWLVVPGDQPEDHALLNNPPDPAKGPLKLPAHLEDMRGAPWPLYQARVININPPQAPTTGSLPHISAIPGIRCCKDGRALLLRVSAMEPMVRPESVLSAWAGREVKLDTVIRAGIWSSAPGQLLTTPLLPATNVAVDSQPTGNKITAITKPDWPALIEWTEDGAWKETAPGLPISDLFTVFSQ